MKLTIIYVFGPKRCQEKYDANEFLNKENGEWVKIGLTNRNDDIDINADNLKDIIFKTAYSRISEESKTGIPEICRIYDTFIFPYSAGKTDDKIRKLLCNDIHTLENSKNINKELDEMDIKAGDEFVYGASKNYIKHAVMAYNSEVLNNAKNVEDLKIIQICNIFNTLEITDDVDSLTDEAENGNKSRKPILQLDSYLQIGDEVVLWNGKTQVFDNAGNPITAKYNGNNTFISYEGIKGSSCGLAKKYLCDLNIRHARVDGHCHWKFNGEFLRTLEL